MSTASNPLPFENTDRRDMFAAFAMLGYVLQGETGANKIAEACTVLADTLTYTLSRLWPQLVVAAWAIPSTTASYYETPVGRRVSIPKTVLAVGFQWALGFGEADVLAPTTATKWRDALAVDNVSWLALEKCRDDYGWSLVKTRSAGGPATSECFRMFPTFRLALTQSRPPARANPSAGTPLSA
jgi:hypothetical protein